MAKKSRKRPTFKKIRLDGKKYAGKFAIVDIEDYEKLKNISWHIRRRGLNFYAVSRPVGGMILMHRLILKAPKGMGIDHINRNGLDNRKCNLRFADQGLNSRNSRTQRPQFKSSQYRGVSWRPDKKKWRACITMKKKSYHLGYFKDELEASRRYESERSKYFEKDGQEKA